MFVWRVQLAQYDVEVRQRCWLVLRKKATGSDHSERKGDRRGETGYVVLEGGRTLITYYILKIFALCRSSAPSGPSSIDSLL